MVCTIHQPMFFQYLGLYRKALKADIFVVYDTAQYSKNDWHNRNKIKTKHGTEWLTVPVTHHLGDSFQVATPANATFVQSHLSILKEAYGKAPFFDEVFPKLKAAYEKPYVSLGEFNWHLQEACFDMLGIKPKIVFSHELDLQGKKATEALVRICQLLDADTYLAGMDAGYMDLKLFGQAGIKVVLNDFAAKPYPQQWASDAFIPNLSVIDPLFNIGPAETRKLIS